MHVARSSLALRSEDTEAKFRFCSPIVALFKLTVSTIVSAGRSLREIIESHIASRLAGTLPSLKESELSDAAQALIHEAFTGVPATNVLDYHSHIISLEESHGWVNPKMLSSLQGKIYLNAALGPTAKKAALLSDKEISEAYIRYLVANVRSFRDVKEPNRAEHARVAAFAFDFRYDSEKQPDKLNSTFYVSNDYVFTLANLYPDVFFPVISINPEKGLEKAIEELKACHKKFARWKKKQPNAEHVPFMMKWLPNAMGMNPSDPAYDRFYQKMKELGCVLLSHTGHEKAVHGEEFQRLGNSQLLTRVNEAGIKVIHAHCGSLGKNKDLKSGLEEENTNLTINVLDKKSGHYGDISALTLLNRASKICQVAARVDQGQLIYGSDYPLPLISAINPLLLFWLKGMITRKEMNSLQEIYRFNPLLYDFVLKRTLRHPEQGWLAKLFCAPNAHAGKKLFEARVFDATTHKLVI